MENKMTLINFRDEADDKLLKFAVILAKTAGGMDISGNTAETNGGSKKKRFL